MDDRDVYDNPLIGRYAGRRMARLWSPREKFSTWRRLWVALAEAERAWAWRSPRSRSPRCGARSTRSTSTPPRGTSGDSATT